jgi:putative FmdB family regulatory protein
MPLYTYYCSECKETTEEIRSIEDRDLISLCTSCLGQIVRKIDTPGMVWSPTSSGGSHKV